MTSCWLFFKVLGNECRLAIVNALKNSPLTVKEICIATGMEQSRVSHNLKCLENCGFVTAENKGRWRIYRLNEETVLPALRLAERHLERYGRKLKSCATLKGLETLEVKT